MTMILHLFKTDVRRLRVLLSVWFALVLLQCVLIGSSASPGDRVLQGLYDSISVMLPLFQIVLLVVIIPHLVQEEPLVGTTAFWFTRPIARTELLGAKALFAALLITLPLLAEVIVLEANGVTLRDIGLAVPEILLGHLVVVVTIAGVAVFTGGFGRYAIAGAVLLVATITVSAVVTWLRLFLHPEVVFNAAQNLSLPKTRGLVQNLWVVGAGGLVIAHQYLTRRTARSLAGVGVLVAGAVAILNFWPWNFFSTPSLPDATGLFDVAAVKVSLQQTTTNDALSIRGGSNAGKDIRADIRTTGMPEGWVAMLRKADSHLAGADGEAVPADEARPGPNLYPPNAADLEHALGGTPVINGSYWTAAPASLLTVTADTYRQHASKPLKLTADLQFTAYRYVVVAEMPVVRGARYDRGSEHVVVTDVLHQGDGLEVLLRRSGVNLLFGRAHGVGDNGASLANVPAFAGNQPVYLLLNQARNQAVLAKRNSLYATGISLFSMNATRLVQKPVRLEFGSESSLMVPALSDEWLAGARLVRLELAPIGTFTRQLTVENFRLDGQNRSYTREAPKPPPDYAVALARITLPENPTKAQVRDYVDSILLNSQRQGRYRDSDPQVKMLLLIGHENLDVLLTAAEQAPQSLHLYIDTVVSRLAGPEDKALVLPLLAEHRALVELVNKYGWEEDARDTLLAGLQDTRTRALYPGWIQAVVALKDPAVYPDLKAYLVRGPMRQSTFAAIRNLPGIDLTDAVAAAWQKAKAGRPSEVIDGGAMAVEFGHADVLDALVEIMKRNESENSVRSAAMLFQKYTTATGDAAAMLVWFEANRDRLTFDPRWKKFVPAAPATTPKLPLENPVVLGQITFPEHATKAQVRDYVDSILLASQRQGRFSTNDPQIGMLLKVGSENLDVLLTVAELAPSTLRFYLETAVLQLAGAEDKALILPALADHPRWVELVNKYGWEEDARDTLVAGIKNPARTLPPVWVRTVAALKDPATYPDLKAYLVRGPNRQLTFNAIRNLPGIDLEATVAAAWQTAKGGSAIQVFDGCEMAVAFGHADVLDALVSIMKKPEPNPPGRHAATLFKTYTLDAPARGDTDALLAWFEANRDRLTFDPQRKKFVPAAPAMPDQLQPEAASAKDKNLP